MTTNKLYNYTAIVLLVFLFPERLSAQSNQDEQPAALVEVENIQAEFIAEHIWVPGTVISRTDADVAAEVAGRITWMADVGSLLQQGEVMATIDSKRLELAMNQNQARLAQWQSRVDLLEKKVQRFTLMANQQNTSKNYLDELSTELEVAQQALRQAQTDIEINKHQLELSQVRAPFTAMLVERMQAPGEYTSVGQKLLRIVDTSNIEITAKAPLSVIPHITDGTVTTVSQGNLQSQQKVRAMVPVGTAESRMMEVRVGLEQFDLAIGSAVRIALPSSPFHKGMTVHRDALVLRKSGIYIYQVDAQNTVEQVLVKTGVGIGERIEVIGDIVNTKPVVIRGAERLSNGQKVRYGDDLGLLTAANNEY